MKTNPKKQFPIPYVSFLFILVLITCVNYECKPQELCLPGSISNDTTHIIPFETAVTYISAFSNSFKLIPDGANPYAPGWSEISINDLPAFTTKKGKKAEPPGYHCGLLTYFCDTADIYYLAFNIERNLSDKADAYVIENPAGNLLYFKVSSCPGHFPANYTIDQIRTYLQTVRPPCNAYLTTQKDYRDVNDEAYSFMDTILHINHGAMENPAGFFHYAQMNKLLSQGPANFKGIRIYWAFENTRYKKEKIRIIAFAVNPDGSNYYKNGAEDAIILERSWPPDVQ